MVEQLPSIYGALCSISTAKRRKKLVMMHLKGFAIDKHMVKGDRKRFQGDTYRCLPWDMDVCATTEG